MKVVSKTVDMIANFDKEGNIRPWRFQLEEDERKLTVNVQRLIDRKIEKIEGKDIVTFKCQSVIHNVLRVYELRFYTKKLCWVLYKM